MLASLLKFQILRLNLAQDKFSKIGFILAVAGSAVGLGNAWKFPYLVGQNGGSAFVLLYLFMTFFIGLAIFFGEIAIGKLSESDPVNAFKKLAPNIVGIPRKKENSEANVLDAPKIIPPKIVEPDLEVPGINEST